MQSNIFYYHLLCVLQSLNLIVLLLDLEFQRFPLVGESQPLLPELNFIDTGLTVSCAHLETLRSFPVDAERMCVLASTNCPILWEEELACSPQHVKDTGVLLLDCLALHQFQVRFVDLVLKEPERCCMFEQNRPRFWFQSTSASGLQCSPQAAPPPAPLHRCSQQP